MTNLEVPRLKMQHFKMIVPLEYPFPTEPAQRVKFVFCGHITPLASVRVFQAHGAHSIAHFVETMRCGSTTSARGSQGSLAQRSTTVIQPGVRAACHARKR